MDQAAFTPAAAQSFSALNASRRAVRQFAPASVPDDVLLELAAEAQLAPSSRNTQPYRFLTVRSAALKERLAQVCNDQDAARTAPALVVVVAGASLARETLDAYERHLAGATTLSEKTRRYHQDQAKKAKLFLTLGALPVWWPLLALLKLISPTATLLPLGASGIRHWTARGAIYAIQTYLLAARARGLGTCPMEGFSAAKVARVLKLPRGLVIPAMIAVGYAAPNARVDPRWRKPLEHACTLL